ncbi:MAG: amidase, partial [Thermosynechococcaceae cyanobacterium]
KVDAAPNQVWDLKTRSLADANNFRTFINLKKGFNEETWSTFRWRQEPTLAQMNEILRKFLKQKQHPFAGFGTIKKLEITERSHGGRVQKLTVTTDIGTVELIKDEIVQGIKGAKSLLFYTEPMFETKPPVTNADNQGSPALPEKVLKGYRFIGGGWGHAVGLSQTGAQHLSQLGWSAPQILKFYYPGTTLEPLTDATVRWREPSIPEPVADLVKENEDGHFLGIRLPKIDWRAFWKSLPFT